MAPMLITLMVGHDERILAESDIGVEKQKRKVDRFNIEETR